MAEITTLFHSPIGIGSVALIILAIVLFIWNLRREELTKEQWLEIKNWRQEPLDNLENTLEDYKNYTNNLTKTEALYNLKLYGLAGKSSTEIYSLITYNKPYAELRDKDEYLDELKSNIEMLVSKLTNKKLRNLIHSLYRREEIAHRFSIFKELYKKHYNPHPAIEKRIEDSNSIPLFEQSFKRVYEWIKIMRRGTDLD